MSAEHIFRLLENIIKIGERLYEDNVFDFIEHPLQNAHGEGKFPECSVEYGASKICLLIKGSNDVIKIPFTHYYCDDWYTDYLEELAEQGVIPRDGDGYPDDSNYEIDEDQFFYEFEYATSQKLTCEEAKRTENGWDYCALECAYYAEAVKEGLAQYFAEEEYFGSIDNHPIYRQQRAIPFYEYKECIDYCDEKTSARISSAESTCKKLNVDCFNPLWIADFIDMYGEDELTRLHKFLEKFDIGDLRASNIGYLDGAPILFDYSGFNEDY